MQANLGAKNHATVMPDANREATVNAIVGAAFGAAGQRCMALSTVIFVGDSADWLPDLVDRARALRMGSGLDPATDVGPMISVDALRRAEQLIQAGTVSRCCLLAHYVLLESENVRTYHHRSCLDSTLLMHCLGVDDGAQLLLDGRGCSVPSPFEKGNFLGPTILLGVDASNRAYREEIFGPVLVCLQVDTLDQVTPSTP